jgi:tetratricopeptide (TPR) repeat protein
MLERAIELDPDFAFAYPLLGWTHFFDWAWMWSDDPEARQRAFEMAQHAVALDDSVGSAHSLLAYRHLYSGHDDEAIAEAEKGVVLNPSNAGGYHHLANVLLFAGQPREAIPLLKKAIRLDPHASFL